MANSSLSLIPLRAKLAVCASLMLATAAHAHRTPPSPVTTTSAVGTLARVEVRDRDTGMSLPIYRHDGRFYVAGMPGHRYAVSLANHLPSRGLMVVSVDGVNALTGETASYAQAGYVLQSGQRYDVTGWRKSTREVAAFTFTALPNSYAARTGQPQDVGAIGVALFRELAAVQVSPTPHAYNGLQRSDVPRAEAAGAARAVQDMPSPPEQRKEKLGTGHGERERSVVERTQFERGSTTPDEVITIYYDSRDNLIAQGVLPRDDPQRPRPFPMQPVADTRGFVRDPW